TPDDHTRWHAGEQPSRRGRNITLRDGDYDQIRTSRGILRLDRDSTSFRHQARKSAGVSGIGHANLSSYRSQPTGAGAADLTCAYYADCHDLSYGQSPYATNIAAEQLRCASINMNAGVQGVSILTRGSTFPAGGVRSARPPLRASGNMTMLMITIDTRTPSY